jgi:hypothetical protein
MQIDRSQELDLQSIRSKNARRAFRAAINALNGAGIEHRLHKSARGVPLLVLAGSPGSRGFVSACWFGGFRMWRVFSPHPQGFPLQVRRDAATPDELVEVARSVLS